MSYNFVSRKSNVLWHTWQACRVVDRQLGYPVLECDDNGHFVVPAPSLLIETPYEHLKDRLESHYIADVYNSNDSAVNGTGVFTALPISKGDFIGTYNGTVFSEEEWDDETREDNFLFNLNDGANGVLLDGSVGDFVNELKYINHSCDPNVNMIEAFLLGSWFVLVIALKDINPNEELLHDFDLHTEDEEFAAVRCTCKSLKCRGHLYRHFPW